MEAGEVQAGKILGVFTETGSVLESNVFKWGGAFSVNYLRILCPDLCLEYST